MIYLDNAATTFPKPPSVVKAVNTAMNFYGANPGRSGHKMAEETAKQVYKCREKVGKFFNCEPEKVVFTMNCTHAINIAIQGLAHKGEHILISDLEHNSVARCVHQLYLDGICSYSVVKTYSDPQETLISFYKAIRPNTKIICCTHASNVFGQILPIEDIAKIAHQQGIYFIADAAQSGGVLNIDLKNSEIDFVCLPGHKGLYGPSGTGLLLCNSDAKLHPLTQGGTGTDSLLLEMPEYLPERLESGTINTAGIIGLSAGISYVEQHSTKKIYEFEMKLCKKIYEELKDVPWVKFYGNEPELNKNVPILSITLGSMNGSESSDWLNKNGNIATRGGFHCAKLAHEKMGTEKIGTCRISPASFNNRADVEALCRLIKRKKIS